MRWPQSGVSASREAEEPRREQHHLVGAERVHVAEPRVRVATAEQAPELLLPGRGAGRELADFFLVPARPAHLGGVRALARGGDDPVVDVEEVAVGVEAELGLDPASALRRHVLVPDCRRLDDVAVAVEHGEVLAHGFPLSKSGLLSVIETTPVNDTATRFLRARTLLAVWAHRADYGRDTRAGARDRARHGGGRRRGRDQRA